MKILVLSDLHLGSREIPIEKGIDNVRVVLNEHIAYIDMLMVNGDFYDSLFSLSSKISVYILGFIDELIELTKNNDVLLRVMAGTYTHDNDQLHHFNTDKHDHVKVIDRATVECFNLNMPVLYLPDDLFEDKSSIIEGLMSKHSINKFAIIFNHGYLTHLIPDKVGSFMRSDVINSDWVSQKCTLFVNGHIHDTSFYKNIVSVGSFERMSHGYEGVKGCILIDFNLEDGTYTVEHIENKKTKKFITFKSACSGRDYIDKYEQFLSDIDLGEAMGLHIRLKLNDPHLKLTLKNITLKKFPDSTVKFDMSDCNNNDDTPVELGVVNEYNTLTLDELLRLVSEELTKHNKHLSVDEIKTLIGGLDG